MTPDRPERAIRARDSALTLDHVFKVYPSGTRALDDVSLALECGHVMGLLGPNGAGKTTLAHIAIGLARPTAGRVRVMGREVSLGNRIVQASIGYMSQEALAFADLTPSEALTVFGRLRGLDPKTARQRTRELMDRLDLARLAPRPIAVLSGGERQRVALGAAAMVPAPVMVLDEPTASLDPAFRTSAWRLVRDLADEGAAVLLVTHLIDEAQAVVDDVAVLVKGRLCAGGKVNDVLKEADSRLRVRIVPDAADPPAWIGAESAVLNDGSRHLLVEPGRLSSLLSWLTAQNAGRRLERIEIRPPTLEEVVARWFPSTHSPH